MLCHAAKSKHRELVLDPYPCVNSDDGRSAFHPDSKDFNALEKEFDQLLRLRKKFGQFGASWTEHHKEIGAVGTGLIQWTVASNRTYLAVLRDEDRITELSSPYQYLLISATPEAEAKFQELRGLHGSAFAFHGSPVGNWHSILRNGLKNATSTKLQRNGAIYGAGICLAKESRMSLSYTLHRGPETIRQLQKGSKQQVPGSDCRHSSSVWNRNQETVSLRMLMIYGCWQFVKS